MESPSKLVMRLLKKEAYMTTVSKLNLTEAQSTLSLSLQQNGHIELSVDGVSGMCFDPGLLSEKSQKIMMDWLSRTGIPGMLAIESMADIDRCAGVRGVA